VDAIPSDRLNYYFIRGEEFRLGRKNKQDLMMESVEFFKRRKLCTGWYRRWYDTAGKEEELKKMESEKLGNLQSI
jgi:hypothetical protein